MNRKLLAAVVTVLLCGLSVGAPPAYATGKRTPSEFYISDFAPFYNGDYLDALRAFQSELRGAIETSQSRWIDSICYEAMCGECYYQMGVLDQALQHYTNALQLYQLFPDWMVKVRFFDQSIRVASANPRNIVPWGASTRQARLGQYRSSEEILQVALDANQTIARGTVVQQGMMFPIMPQEVVRSTALALRRRAALLGPVGKFDTLSSDVMASMNRSIGHPNHWSAAYIDLERGLAMIQGGKQGQGVALLQRSVLAGGEFDHPLTSIALLELGKQALARGDYSAAAKFFDETTYAAVNYPDYGVLEEAFRYGTATHLASNGKGFFAPLLPAIQWAKVNRLRQLRASLLLCAAENYAVLGQTKQAAAMLDEARLTIGQRKMATGSIGARLNYISAMVAFQQKRTPEGNNALAAAMAYMQRGSLWLFHIGLADRLYVDQRVSARSALDLFGEVLRDPLPADWSLDPMESLSVLTTPQPLAMEHWFGAAMERGDVKELQAALEIAERTRRRRFFASLEFGGRLESLRWILEAPSASLPKQAISQRQDILARYPDLQQLSQRSQAIRDALGKRPLVAEDQAAIVEQTRQLGELASIGARQEAILREIALRREPAELVFPPLLSVPEVQKSMPDKQAALVFFVSGRSLYGFLLNNEKFSCWRVNTASLLPQIQTLLRDMGQIGPNHEVNVKDLGDAKWKQSGRQVLDTLLKDSPADFSTSFDELVIVPDGILWYLPFEALQVVVDKKSQALISRFRIRYAPTLSLCTSQWPGHNAAGNTAVVVGKLYPRDETTAAKTAFDQLNKVVPGAVALRSPLPAASSIYGTLFRRLIVLDDLVMSEQEPYGWSLAPVDRGKAGSTVGEWLLLPWGGPDVVVLPGFHTAAEDGLKRARRRMPGNEIFLSVCGLMANGSRTVLLSRWRTGGQTSFDLVREFAQELPRTSPADAWQRAVLLAMDSRLSFDTEPRVKHGPNDEAPKASHPFFWAGYMLVDMGAAAEKAGPEPGGPVIKVKKPDPPAVKEEPKEEVKEEPKEEVKGKPKRKSKSAAKKQ